MVSHCLSSSRRRRLHHSSDAAYLTDLSHSYEEDITDSLRLAQLLDIPEPESSHVVLTSQNELGRLLSQRTIVSTTSSFAEAQTAASKALQIQPPLLKKIGFGTCGSVISQEGTEYVFKLQKHESGFPVHDLFNDFKMHSIILNGIRSVPTIRDGVKIPYLSAWIPSKKAEFWEQHAHLFSTADTQLTVPCNAIRAERVLPLPYPIRRGLIDTFCPPELREKAHTDPKNNSCLVRVYLGKRQQDKQQGFNKRIFSLYNFQMNLDQMLQVGLEVQNFAYHIAGTLAALHWSARVDARDVEFILGSSPSYDANISLTETDIEHLHPDKFIGPEDLSVNNWHKREVGLWLIDFNLCKRITFDDSGVEAAIKAWEQNDPYFPKPLQTDNAGKELWNIFASRYIDISDEILKESAVTHRLPRKFLQGIIEVERVRQSKRLLSSKVE